MNTTAPSYAELSGDERAKRARKFGRANGFKGDRGGWIRDVNSQAVCQGWVAFYNRYRNAIEALREVA